MEQPAQAGTARGGGITRAELREWVRARGAAGWAPSEPSQLGDLEALVAAVRRVLDAGAAATPQPAVPRTPEKLEARNAPLLRKLWRRPRA